MAGERFRVAHIDHALEHLQRVETFRPASNPPFTPKVRSERLFAPIFLGHRVERVVGKAGIIDPGDHGDARARFRGQAGILHVALDPQRECFHALKQQKTVERRHRGAGIALRTVRQRAT